MPVPIHYRRSAEGAIASYDYVDLAEGTGIVTVYGFGSDASGAITQALDRNIIEPGTEQLLSGWYPKRSKIDAEQFFSLSAFNLPKTVKGNCYITFTWVTFVNSGTVVRQIRVKVYKNTTLLATEETTTHSTAATKTYTTNLKIPISLTHFKKGDVFKVSFIGIGSGDGNCYLMHDPENRDFTEAAPNITAATNPTALKVYIPFRIDL